MLAGFFAPPTQGGRFAASWLSSSKDRAALVRFGAPGVSRSGARISSHRQLFAAPWILGLSLRLLARTTLGGLRHTEIGIAGSSISRAKTLRLWIHPAPPSGRCFNMVADGSSSTSGRSLTRRNLVTELIATRLSAARAAGILSTLLCAEPSPCSRCTRATRSYPRARGRLLLGLRSVAWIRMHRNTMRLFHGG
jgi:hypothetical protein